MDRGNPEAPTAVGRRKEADFDEDDAYDYEYSEEEASPVRKPEEKKEPKSPQGPWFEASTPKGTRFEYNDAGQTRSKAEAAKSQASDWQRYDLGGRTFWKHVQTRDITWADPLKTNTAPAARPKSAPIAAPLTEPGKKTAMKAKMLHLQGELAGLRRETWADRSQSQMVLRPSQGPRRGQQAFSVTLRSVTLPATRTGTIASE